MAINQIAKTGLSSLQVIYYFENLFRMVEFDVVMVGDVFLLSFIFVYPLILSKKFRWNKDIVNIYRFKSLQLKNIIDGC
ncbi:hypothetical protein XBKQ1_930001 [Xenorhabdus bovienii str. kraussei Quebec]|uniref:Uncharacterized protein n=1 Tax=Xenorhabdus bovienii str. kraussei Quebec TaxID=1398203 RepID=A0A077PQJ9_XENBV|nr:hypothetical protein XBKQ1_930001 [Xenorhabdus bovienii str. kraussei Quebec]